MEQYYSINRKHIYISYDKGKSMGFHDIIDLKKYTKLTSLSCNNLNVTQIINYPETLNELSFCTDHNVNYEKK